MMQNRQLKPFVYALFMQTWKKHLRETRKCLIYIVDQPGLEPGTSRLWVCCSNQLSYKSDSEKRGGECPGIFSLVVLPGFEPGLREPKTLVLPLHHSTILKSVWQPALARGQKCLLQMRLQRYDNFLKWPRKNFFLWFYFCFLDVCVKISSNLLLYICELSDKFITLHEFCLVVPYLIVQLEPGGAKD